MYFLRYSVLPAATNPERNRYGEALVCCWIDRRTRTAADKVARRQIEKRLWNVTGCETVEKVTAADYVDDDWLVYYQQAVADKEVFLYHLSPRFPVYVVFAVVERAPAREVAEAVYLVSGESLLRDDETDVSAPDFWDAGRRRRVVAAARRAIRSAGWTVQSVREHRPCGRDDLAEDMSFYYDEAETEGACLVLLHDGDESSDAPEGPIPATP